MKILIVYNSPGLDGRLTPLRADLAASGAPGFAPGSASGLALGDLYVVEGPALSPALAAEILADPVSQRALIDPSGAEEEILPGWTAAIEVAYLPGVTNPLGMTARRALQDALGPISAAVETSRLYLFKCPGLKPEDYPALAALLHNPLVERAAIRIRGGKESLGEGLFSPAGGSASGPAGESPGVESFDLGGMSPPALEEFSRTRLLALTLPEMQAVQGYYARPETAARRGEAGLPPGPTDVELEMIAQTWSEHCKHKILNATIHYTQGGKTEVIHSLFQTYIKGTTDALLPSKPFLKSLFTDNAGVIEFDQDTLLCFKVETHNSPSALDPYGGAITGIVGVNRDILGTGKGAKPIFNTNVLCFGEPDTPPESLPPGLLSPRRILRGVHRGIVDGGNQSGIPTVAGAFLFDESYRGKPLVFCGTGGILPRQIRGEEGFVKHIDPGDLAVMVGGRIGKDGIHGATFSSLALDSHSPSSAVQIGDPITQKNMTDFLMEARDRGLYKGITDNGAGGLSSSLGEMAETAGGLRVDLDKCPLKYPGLRPWEIWVSESQERMSLSVAPESLPALLELAGRRDVEAGVLGEFTSTGFIELSYRGQPAALISLDFLHHGLPVMELEARWEAPSAPAPPPAAEAGEGEPEEILTALLGEPNITSKEALIRQYDHEVQGRSVEKPFTGLFSDAPSDGAVLAVKPGESFRGITLTHGICPRLSLFDTYAMAAVAVDEALRAHVALGGDPDSACALDNFCWPDPVASPANPGGPYKLAQAVRACRGLQDACLAYGLPLISGKDSMKNDAVFGGKRVSVQPTLLISLLGIIPDYRRGVSTDFKRPGDLIILGGTTRGEMAGSSYEKLLGPLPGSELRPDAPPPPDLPQVKFDEALKLYRRIHQAMNRGLIRSCHDLSDGGLGVALGESAMGGRLGVQVDLSLIPGNSDLEGFSSLRLLFCETPSRLLLTIAPEDREALGEILADSPWGIIGTVQETPNFLVNRVGRRVLELKVSDLALAFTRSAPWQAAEGSPEETPPPPASLPRSAAPPRTLQVRPRVCVITGCGINADEELKLAFDLAGGEAQGIHIRDLIAKPSLLDPFSILGFPGGFSFGDHLGSGLVFAQTFRRRLEDRLKTFIAGGGLIIGICNGFQALVKMGVLPNLKGRWEREATLLHNDTGVFEDSWLKLKANPDSPCLWTRNLGEIELPIRHGEGRFFPASAGILSEINRLGLAALHYRDRNPNGSAEGIAGICDPTGRIFGLMPHPEAFLIPQNHPRWNRSPSEAGEFPLGLEILRRGVEFAADTKWK
ncbi:MAG: phosphoribosylformylglycinamidine synthase subunit PurQ [Spirochaetales bacterium]|jgi:phosphoribosylformylglycinamidine synthase|nr:phosphoribosylformylglycinamidine synthase subunit PurQ [Spirochaetales bacterium]